MDKAVFKFDHGLSELGVEELDSVGYEYTYGGGVGYFKALVVL